ncbi:hypothetical protein [Streptomyces sp. NPDC101150]
MILQPGPVLALEPMFIAGGRDAYAVRTAAVTEGGPVIFTLP